MGVADPKRRFLGALLLAAVYFVIAVGFGEFASRAASNSRRETWNRSAFLVSGVAFAVHIGYEHFRLRNSARITAWHTALAVAAAAFALALKANIHDLMAASSYRPRMLVALLAWPLLTGVPAFIVALGAAAMLARLPTKRSGQ